MKDELNILENRRQKKYSKKEIVFRILWSFSRIIFKNTPRNFFYLRNTILRMFGAKIGNHVHIYPSARIYYPWNLTIGDWSAIGENTLIYNLGHVTIGKKSTISHNAHLCAGTHDYTIPSLPLLKPQIIIEDQVWIATEAFIGPGITIGEGAVVGACACVYKNINPWNVVGGNPAKTIKTRVIKTNLEK